MKKITLLLALMVLSITAGYAQANAYSFEAAAGTYVPITGGTVVTSSTNGDPNLDSYASSQIALPAPFTFAGTTYNNFYVTSNGQVALGTTAPSATAYTVLSTSTAGNVFLSPLSADLEEGANGLAEIRYEMVGNEIVVQWSNWRRYAKVESFGFQVRMNTSTGVIKFVYNGNPPYDSSTSYQPQVGIKSAAGVYSALTVASGSSWSTPVNITTGIASGSTASLTGSNGFTAGLTYTFTPPAPCSGTPVAGTPSGNAVRYICNGSAPGAITVTGATLPIPGISYQWEESLNGTDWNNATGGTGATTTAYTPPSFSGTPIQYRLKVICTNSSESAVTSAVNITNQIAPDTQVSAVTVTAANISATSLPVSWTNGSGNRRMVVVSDAAITDPVNIAGGNLNVNNTYAGSGQQIIYDGTGTSTTIYGLNCNTSYNIKVYEYNRCGSDPYDMYFNTTTGTNIASATTTVPATATSLPVVNNFTGFTGANLSTAVPGWYEAAIPTSSGVTQPGSVAGGTTSNWVSSTVFGSTTTKVNLYYYSRNEWVISPKVELTSNSRLKFKAAITNYNSASADSDGMQGTDDVVRVLISTDGCGAVWTPLYTFNAANTTTLTNALTDFELALNAYTGQTVQIAFQAVDGPVDDTPDYDFHIGDIIIEEVPACEMPTLLASTNITKNSATINWEAALGTPPSYEYVVATSETAPAGAGTATSNLSATVNGLAASTNYYVFVRSVCAAGVYSEWTAAGEFMTLCEYPDITGTTPGTACGQGEVELSATAASGGLYWFSAATAGDLLGTGGTFTTPLITETTSFYVSSASSASGVDVPVGAGASTSSTYSNPFYSAWSNNHTQHLITAQELLNAGLSAGPINSVALDVTSPGSLPMINLSVKIGTTNATSMEAFAEDALTVVYTSPSYMPVAGINALTFDAPFVWDGTSNILVEFCHGNENSTATMSRTVRTDATSYVSSVKRHFSAATSAESVCTATTGGSVSTYSVRPQFYFNGVGLCYSPRQEVVATVTDAPAITVAATNAVVCAGDATEISVTSPNTDYTYVWMPGNLTGATQTVNPTETTTYMVTATDAVSGCVAIEEIEVVVNPLPANYTVELADTSLCAGSTAETSVVFDTNAVIGTGTTAPGTTSYPNPFSAYYGGVKTQMLYTSAELAALGMTPGAEISSLSFDFFASAAKTNNDLTIRMGGTTATELTDGFVPSAGLTTVYNQTFTPVAGTTGFVAFDLTTPFVWNGGNLIVEVVHNAGNYGNGSGTRNNTTTTSFNSVYYGAKDNVTPAGVASFDALELADYSNDNTSTSRPNIAFAYTQSMTTEWSPVTGLFTDAEATVPYTGGNATTVYFVLDQDVTYTVTVTNTNGCSSSYEMVLSPTNLPAPEFTDVNPVLCNGATIADLSSDETVVWYAAETGGEQLAAETTLVNATTYYAATATDGCESLTRTAVNVTLSVVATPVVTVTQPDCTVATGGITVTSPVGTDYTYSINGTDYQASATFSDLAAGTYAVTAMNALGCTSDAATVTIDAAPVVPAVATLTVTQPTCAVATGSIEVTEPIDATYTYSINGVDYQSSTTFAGLSAGVYTVTVMSDGGCTSQAAPVTIIDAPVVPEAAVVSVTQPDCTTALGTIEITSPIAATNMYSIDGVNYQASSVFTDLAAGTYSITVMNNDGCTSVAVEATINEAPEVPAAPSVTVAQPTCANDFGTLVVTAPVGADYTYSINGTDFQSEVTFENLAAGTYSVTVMSAGGCTEVTENLVINEGASIAAPTGEANQVITADTAEEATLEDIVVNIEVGGTVTWYATEADALAGINPLDANAQLTDGATYYAVQTIGECSSTEVLAVTVSLVLNKDEFNATAFTYYPNPVKDQLTIKAGADITTVEVFNMLGQKVMGTAPKALETVVDMSQLSDGTYLVNVMVGNTAKTIKVVKKQ